MNKVLYAIALSVFAYAIYINNFWAEPEPEEAIITPAFYVEIEPAKDSNEIVLELETLENSMDEMELLARCVEAEAGNQSILGKRLVVDTILNRVDSPDFPDTIQEVIFQPNQFAVAGNGQIDNVQPTAETYEAITLEYMNRISNEIIYFQAGGYSYYGGAWEHVGDHYFSVERRD